MKSPAFITFALLFVCGQVLADVPVKKPLQSYSRLWTPSPFTKPPVTTAPPETVNQFKDYHLTGIAPVEGGYLITIANKKDKNAKKIVIEPGSDTNSKFKVVKVERNPNIRLGTVVTLSDGVTQGEVRFEPDLVVLNTPVNQNPGQQLPPGINPGQQFPPGFNPNQQNQQTGNQATPATAPRSRIVPPTNPNNPGQGASQNTGQGSGNSLQNRGNGSGQSRPPRNR